MDETWKQYRPLKDHYVAAKLLELLPLFYRERGKFIIGLYAYIRWVDNKVDEVNGLSSDQKSGFLHRQNEIVADRYPDNLEPMEELFKGLSWQSVPESGVKHHVRIILSAIGDDLDHHKLAPRSDREIRHYNWRTIWPVVDGLFLVLNKRPIREGKRFMDLLDGYMSLGNLEELGEDLKHGLIKLPIKEPGRRRISISRVLSEYDHANFFRKKEQNLAKITRNFGAVTNLDIPVWQKITCLLYLTEATIKKKIGLSRNKALGPLNSIDRLFPDIAEID